MSGARQAVVAAVVATIVLALPGPALALTTRETTDTTTNGDGLLVATAECPSGAHIVSGGFSSSPEATVVISKAAPGEGWTVRAFPGDTTTLTASANCSGNQGVSRHHKTVDAPPDAPRPTTSVARCDADEDVVSGGWAMSKPAGQSNSPVFKSRRTGTRSWGVTAFVDTNNAKLTAYAYCRRNADVTVRSDRSDPILDEGDGSATAKCHEGETLLSGGYTTSPKSDFDNDTGPDFFYYGSSRSGSRAWTASAHNYSTISGRITTFAYCAA